MLSAPLLPARIPRPITDKRLAQAHAVEEFFEALLGDLYQDMRSGAVMLARNYDVLERICQPRAVVRVGKRATRRGIVALPRIRKPEPVTDARLELAFAAERLLDAILEDLFQDVISGAPVVSRKYRLLWLHKPPSAVTPALRCAVG